MKKYRLPLLLAFGIVALTSATMRSGGSPEAKTSSPLDGNNCSLCHTGNAVITNEEFISSNIPETGYVAGETYVVTISKPSTSTSTRWGFELTSETENEKIGTWAIKSEATKLITDKSAVTHNPAADVSTWEADWTAPTSGKGEVIFYAAVNSSNGNFGTSGDQIYTSSLKVSEKLTVGFEEELANIFKVYPNPCVDQITVEGVNAELVEIYTVNGEKVLSTTEQSIDVSALAAGNYLLKANADSEVLQSTFTKK